MKNVEEVRDYLIQRPYLSEFVFKTELDEAASNMADKIVLRHKQWRRTNFDRIWAIIFGRYSEWVDNYELDLSIYVKNPDIIKAKEEDDEIIDGILSETERLGSDIRKNLVKYKTVIRRELNELSRENKDMYDLVIQNFGSIFNRKVGEGRKISNRKIKTKQLKSKSSIKKTIFKILNS